MSTRIYLLAKKLGIQSRELIDILRRKGFDVSSASSSVADIYAEDLMREFGSALAVNLPRPSPAEPSSLDGGGCAAVAVAFCGGKSLTDAERAPASEQRSAVMPILCRAQPQATQEPRRMVPLEKLQQSSGRFGTPRYWQRGPAQDDRRQFGGGNFGGNQDRRGGGQQSQWHFSGGRPQQSHGQQPHGQPAGGKALAPAERSGERCHFSPGFNRGPERRHGSTGAFRAPARQQFQQSGGRQPQRNGFSKPPPRPPHPMASSGGAMAANRPQHVERVGGERGADNVLRLKFPVCVREFAPEVGLKPFQLISELMQLGIFASMNYLVDEALAKRIGEKLSIAIEARQERPTAVRREVVAKESASEAVLEARPPVVCVLGHVDHGKTTLLDRIRQANVAAGEDGGITQHIGAYEVSINDSVITFIDTPGHAAFSKMRERGATITDVAILVVAADDGFMPQTDEALKFLQRASVPVVVAINKIDAKGANGERVRQQMQQRGIAPEEWGGETLCCDISALNGDGVSRLLELVAVQAEMLALVADRNGPVEGTVLESQIETGRGPTASAIIVQGTLKVGDALVCGENCCKVRAMVDDRGRPVKEALPSKAVKIIGWDHAPDAGSTFSYAESERVAREMAEECCANASRGDDSPQKAQPQQRRRSQAADSDSLNALFAAIDAKQKRLLRLIVKGDVHGRVEALCACLETLPQDKIGLEIIRSDVGPVSLGDVDFARPVGATIVAFGVKAENGVQAALKQHGVVMLRYNVIYMALDGIRDAMADLLEPELQEEKLGGAQVRKVFVLSKGIVAGCMVTDGKVLRDGNARLWREGKQIFDGKISSLRREKTDVGEVRAGYECGVLISGYGSYAVGDVIECYKVNRIRASL